MIPPENLYYVFGCGSCPATFGSFVAAMEHQRTTGHKNFALHFGDADKSAGPGALPCKICGGPLDHPSLLAEILHLKAETVRLKEALDEAQWQQARVDIDVHEKARRTWLVLGAAWRGEELPYHDSPNANRSVDEELRHREAREEGPQGGQGRE